MGGFPDEDLKNDDIVDKVLAEENVRKTGAGGSNGSSSASRVSQTKPKKSGPCGHCGKSGHDESSCWRKHPEKKPKKGGNKPSNNGDKGNGHNGHIHSATNESSVAPLVNTSSESSQSIHASFYDGDEDPNDRTTIWLMDSGASDHITNDINDFHLFTPYA